MTQPRKTFDDVRRIVDAIRFLDRRFRLMTKGDGYLLQLEYFEPDVDTPTDPTPKLQRARKWYVSPYATETEIVETAFKACRTSMEHVVKEHFSYQGERVYSPHFDVGARLEACRAKRFDGAGGAV